MSARLCMKRCLKKDNNHACTVVDLLIEKKKYFYIERYTFLFFYKLTKRLVGLLKSYACEHEKLKIWYDYYTLTSSIHLHTKGRL